MRKTVCLLFLLLWLVSLPLFSGAEALLTAEDFTFAFDDEIYHLGDLAAPLIAAMEAKLGPVTVFEAESCLFSGQDKEFECDGILIATYPIGQDGADVIETFYVMNPSDAYRTARGIAIGASKQEVVDAYGAEFTLDHLQMLYASGDPLAEPVLVFELDPETERVITFYMMRNTGG